MVKNKKSYKKLVVLAILILLVSGLIGGLYYLARDKSETSDISLAPATQQEKADVEKNKEEIVQQEDERKDGSTSISNNSSSGITVTVTSITAEGVYAFVSGVLEDGGTCTAYYSKGSESFQRKSNGFMNVSNTQCEPIQTNRSDFSSNGVWNVTVTYDGSASQTKATSQTSTITIQ